MFANNNTAGSFAELNDDTINTDDLLAVFIRHAPEHPCISRFIKNPSNEAMVISDYLTQNSFRSLDLYRKFYQNLGIEDQLSVGRMSADFVLYGISVNRGRRGFDIRERRLIELVGNCLLPLYLRLEKDSENASQKSLIEICVDEISNNAELVGITSKEASLLSLVGAGKSNKQIADILSLSQGTVRKHLENCYRKLGVNNRVSAVLTAMALIQQGKK